MQPGLAVAFAGTPDFAVPSLDAIAASRHRLVVAYTQPDRPAGRGLQPAESPVKARARALGLPVEQPATLRTDDAAARLAAYAPDVLVVAAWGLLLPRAILDLPPQGCINVHASLLPRWRGASPVAHAILAGDAQTGVCIMRMEAGLDTGPVMLREETAIGGRETAGELQARLAAIGAGLVVRALDALADGSARFEPQDDARATHAPRLGKSQARIDWNEPAVTIARRVRAFQPWPVAQAALDGEVLRIHEAEAVGAAPGAAPGTVLPGPGLVVLCGEGALAIRRIQAPGRRVVAADEFARARPLAGRVLG